MKITLEILTALLVFAAIGSAIAKFRISGAIAETIDKKRGARR